ncbi:MAG: hypothetical protein HY290_00890 [Planctomycetia bacterium]|nr:hypothetical protein [Planctomycetia bacterium]
MTTLTSKVSLPDARRFRGPRRRGMIESMDERNHGVSSDISAMAHVVALLVCLGNVPLVCEFWISGDPSPALCVPGAIVAAYAITFVVSWTNRRHDPRYAKRPSDAP